MRTFLVLARVSNLPTVWSNCLAAWLLCGGRSWVRFGLLSLGATLLYTGGMFLNDAVDEGFDRRYRPERPIPSGLVTSRTVWALSFLWLGAGWAIFLFLGTAAIVMASLLFGTIVLYDIVHKRTILAPLLMAACRFLLYLLAASVVAQTLNPPVLWRSAALAAYIIGLSYLARGESTGALLARWTLALVFVPALVCLLHPASAGMNPWNVFAVVLVQVTWTIWCLWRPKPRLLSAIPQGVAGLLAGIALVDWLAAIGFGLPCAFICLFLLAFLLQRLAPAT
jgi:hypothetical protein